MDIQITEPAWHEIGDVGYPPASLQYIEEGIRRTFLLRTEFRITSGAMYDDGAEFEVPEGIDEHVVAWAIIKGF
jgi:hypothetical protein